MTNRNDRRPLPSLDVPDTCEYGGCDGLPDFRVKFRNPVDFVFYCEEHAAAAEAEKNFVESSIIGWVQVP